jgi:hypothetical protein
VTRTTQGTEVGDLPVPRSGEATVPRTAPDLPRVVTNLRHGEHVAGDDVTRVDPTRRADDGTAWTEVKRTSTPFRYLFDDLRDLYPEAHLPAEPAAVVVASLKALGSAMVDQPGDPASADSTIPPIYTYWGQFVDHDLTANTDRNDDISITDLPLEPLQPERVERDLRNLREPRLNLDSVYGNGPQFSGQPDQVPYEGDRLKIGRTTAAHPAGNVAIKDDDAHDLPRIPDPPRVAHKAQLGDGRNDENLIVAQLHLAFLKFHNAVLDWFAAHPDSKITGDGGFERARQLVQWHYQWITVHDFLKRIADNEVVDGLLDGTIPPRFAVDQDTPTEKVFMPLEFSIAAYRFGHSMVRAAYDWNENFGFPGDRSASSSFELLFTFTGNGGFFGNPTLPDNWPAQFERLTGFEATPPDAVKPTPPRFARKIDTHLAPPLADLSNEGTDETADRIKRILRRLAVRNLLRGYRLALPTGQAVARSLDLTPLRKDQLLTFPEPDERRRPPTPVDDALVDGAFLESTPLWFYVLREAEVLGDKGERLGPVGSRIVAETIIGQLRADPTSFLNQGWDPTQGVSTGPSSEDAVDSIITFLRFAGMHP